MDPVTTTLLAAFTIGAVQGATQVGEQAVKDAYAALKAVVTGTYSKVAAVVNSIADLEAKPESLGRRQTLAEELEAADANNDEKLLAAAEAVISAAKKAGAIQAIGLDWQDVEAARLKIGSIRTLATGGNIGFRAARMRIAGSIEINSINVGDGTGK